MGRATDAVTACWQAELQDAERVLCSVAMLKSGMCSGRAAQKVKELKGARGMHARSVRRGTKKASLSHFASDVQSSVVGMFSPDGGGAAR